MITGFFGAGDRSTLQKPVPAFFFGVRTVSFSQKRNGLQGKPSLVGKLPNPFLFGGAQKETVSGCQRKRPGQSLGASVLLLAPGNDVKKQAVLLSASGGTGQCFRGVSAPLRGAFLKCKNPGAPNGSTSAPKAAQRQGVTPGSRASQ